MRYSFTGILLSLVSVAWARPDVSHLSYEPSGSYLPGVSGGHFGSGSAHHGIGVHSGGHQFGGVHGGSGYRGGFGGQTGFFGSGGHGGYYGTSGSYGFGSEEDTEVHFYGDDSHQQSRLRIHVAPAPSRNKVLFVKSPEVGSSIIPEIIAPSAPSHERTVVYVLSKKQDAVGTINLPASVTHNVVKTKPEVFYVKYKDAHDAERVVADSLSGKVAGSGVKSINDKDSFVRTLSSGAHGGINGILGSFGSSSFGSGGGYGGVTGISGGHSGTLLETSGSSSSGSKYGAPGASGPY
ncbi:hypothetical protein PPYR_09988 [Photinus pyralis]|uniref:DUF243 domain-containing protein n=1 Tax=Photinus pyralis TaxID=7054 RepID=A0A5N4AF19_PHOPY|nr:hypothetical protein PPYR_09988 [Photinus pyralis]